MKRHTPPHGSTPAPVDERDWLAQERALGGAGDARDALLARALREPPVSQPPPDFAAAVARLAATAAPLSAAVEPRLERVLLAVLAAAMGLAALVALAIWGGQWWALSAQAIGAATVPWVALAGGCLLLSWLPGAARGLLEASRAPVPA